MSVIRSLAHVLQDYLQKVKQQNARVMKTTRTILSIALVALTTTLFARIDEPNADCNCCPNEVELIMEQDQGLENWMVEPFEASIDKELSLEEWMTLPFESSIEEEQLRVESWMAASWI